MENSTPKENQKHNNSNYNDCNDRNNTFNKWIQDPNGLIAIVTIIIALIGFGALCISYRAVHISEDAEKRQLRAYVTPAISWTSISGSVLDVKFTIVNFGQTPAKNCTISGDGAILPFPLPALYKFQIPPAPYAQKARIDPKTGAATPYEVPIKRTFNSVKFAEILSKDISHRFYYFGVLNYQDVFGKSHFTKFCSFLTLEFTPEKHVGTYTWSDCDQHNEFD